MTAKPELVLDIGGVLVSNLSPAFWQELSIKSAIPHEILVNHKNNIREALWTGKISDKEFWNQLSNKFPTVDIEMAQQLLHSTLKPLPALRNIPIWNEYANIHLLSNHRIEWVEPLLLPIQGCIKSITISSQAGCMKPKEEIYSLVHAGLGNQKDVLFIDDLENNFIEAKKRGWQTLLADEDGNWIEKVIPLLNSLTISQTYK